MGFLRLEHPTAATSLTAGEGIVDGITATTDDDVFVFAGGKADIQAKGGTLWLQTPNDGGMVCTASATVGTTGNLLNTAGAEVQIYAGAAMADAVGDAGSPPGAPTKPGAPCPDTANRVKALNAINSGIKAGADFATADNNWDRAAAVWDGLKAARDGASPVLTEDQAEGLDGVIAVGDAAFAVTDVVRTGADALSTASNTAGNFDTTTQTLVKAFTQPENAMQLFGAAQKVKKVPGAVSNVGDALGLGDAGAQGDDASGGGTGSAAAAGAGSTKIIGQAPAGIEWTTDASIAETAAAKIEMMAGSNIEAKATVKIETSSLVFESFASVSSKVIGLASATVKSIGKATLDGKGFFFVKTKGAGAIDAGATLDISSPATTVKSAQMTIKGGKLDIKSKLTQHPAAVFKNTVAIEKTLDVTQGVTCKDGLTVQKSPANFSCDVNVKKKLTASKVCNLG